MSTQTTETTISINGTPSQIDETTHIDEMRDSRPQFFKNTHGKRETFNVYRGFLIVRNTNTFGAETYRSTTVYVAVVCPGAYDGCIRKVNLSCIYSLAAGETIQQSKKRIDAIITAGKVDTY